MHARLMNGIALAALVGIAVSHAAETDGAPTPSPAPASLPPSRAARRGLVDFGRYCSSCHGWAGDGQGKSADRFEAAATDFTRGVYKCRSTPSGSLPTDDDLRRSIVQGLDGSGMPPFNTLGPLQIEDLVETLKHFSARFAGEPPGKPIEVPRQPARDAASIARGAQVYERLKCANCHGRRGEGGPGAANLRNDDGTPAHATDFTRRDSLRCGSSPDRVYVMLMSGLDGTPMGGYLEAVAPADAWDLVHYVLSLSRR